MRIVKVAFCLGVVVAILGLVAFWIDGGVLNFLTMFLGVGAALGAGMALRDQGDMP